MKTIIIYASKYGATKQLAERIAEATQIKCIDIKDFHESIEDYDKLVFGSSVYAGMLRKEIKEFIKKHEELLCTKRVYMFMSGLNKEDSKKVLSENIGETFYESLSYVDTLGGVLDLPNLNFFEKNIIKMINKKAHFFPQGEHKKKIDLLDEQRILTFIQEVKR